MRTTIDLPDALFRKAKAAASLDGKSLKAFVTEALEAKLYGQTGKPASRIRFPLVRSRNPGSLRLDADTVAEALEEEDERASGRR